MAGPVAARSLKITAPVVVVDWQTILRDAAVIVHDGKVARVGPADVMKLEKVDRTIHLPRHILHPGFINCHCHLELSYMAGKLTPRAPFTDWISELIALRTQAKAPHIRACITTAVRRLARAGVTCVGDVCQTGLPAAALAKSGLRGVIFHEVIALDPALAPARFEDLLRRISEAKKHGGLLTHGVAPHAAYSTSAELISLAAKYAAEVGAPMSMHMLETREETQFCGKGTGPFKNLLEKLGQYSPEYVPRQLPMTLAAEAGALKNGLMAHFNHPSPGDIASLKKYRASVAFCPNSNRWFGRSQRHPVAKLIRNKINVGLGTDSLASNTDLDMRAEMRTLIKTFPALGHQTAFYLSTQGSAMALGLSKLAGTLLPGALFDAAALETKISPKADPLRSIIISKGNYSRLWVNGRPVSIR